MAGFFSNKIENANPKDVVTADALQLLEMFKTQADSVKEKLDSNRYEDHYESTNKAVISLEASKLTKERFDKAYTLLSLTLEYICGDNANNYKDELEIYLINDADKIFIEANYPIKVKQMSRLNDEPLFAAISKFPFAEMQQEVANQKTILSAASTPSMR